jgi:DNA-directed RNA polymerase specialized sigma24 family protein
MYPLYRYLDPERADGREGTMSSDGSVSCWIGMLKGGDREAAQRLWDAYSRRLIGLARARLRGVPTRMSDEEDVALSAFDSLCRGAEEGRFPRLDDRDDLWQLLVMITVRKAIDLAQHERRAARGGGRVRTLSDLADDGSLDVLGAEPTPELAAMVADECRHLLGKLDNDLLRSVALLKMEGCTNQEVADRLGCVVSTVDRRLRMIRQIWSEEGDR